jgi:hypothetical protein
MIFRSVFCLHTRQVPLEVAHIIAILVYIVGTLDTFPLATMGWNLVTNLIILR